MQKEGLILTELYNEKQTTDFTLVSRLLDYGVILTALYPLAAWKSRGDFLSCVVRACRDYVEEAGLPSSTCGEMVSAAAQEEPGG